jgi:hypothetical protein
MQQPDYGLPVLLGILVLVAFVLPSLGLEGSDQRLYGDLAATLMVVSGLVVVSGERRVFVVTALIVVTMLLVRWAAWLYPPGALGAWPAVAGATLVLTFSCVILLQVMRPGPVTLSRVLGAIAVYLLLGIGWASGYEVAEHFFPGSFASTTSQPVELGDWVYFSFITLTTVGYGDMVPVHRVARALATGEALTGQLYIAVLLARLVSLEVSSRHRPGA